MSEKFNVEHGIRHVRQVLDGLGFTPRDADGNDFQRGSDTHIRFKVGGVYGEVTAQVFVDNQRRSALRFLTDAQLDHAEEQIVNTIDLYKRPTLDISDRWYPR